MSRVCAAFIAVAISGFLAHVVAQSSPPAAAQGRGAAAPTMPAPPSGAAAIYKADPDLAAVLKKAIETAPAMATSPVANTDQYRINVIRRGKGAGAIAHPGNTELHYVIDGAATFVSGGTIARPAAAGAVAEIRGGESRHVAKGDVVVIPEN